MPTVEIARAVQRIEFLDEELEELEDLILLVSRALTDQGQRTALDDAIAQFGYTREALEALPDEDD